MDCLCCTSVVRDVWGDGGRYVESNVSHVRVRGERSAWERGHVTVTDAVCVCVCADLSLVV